MSKMAIEPREALEELTEGRSAIPPHGRLLFVSCRSAVKMAARVLRNYLGMIPNGVGDDILHLKGVDFNFSDSETCVKLERDVSGGDVFLFQSLYDPTAVRSLDENLTAFLIAVRALKEWGANRITAVLPYLAYARQEKPTKYKREPATLKLLADLSIEAGIDRLVTWNPHPSSIRAYFKHVPVDHLGPDALFLEEYRQFEGRSDVIAVAPDAGATKFITHFARRLDLNSAIASKYRPRPEEAMVSEVIGDFRGKRTALVLDDMISSGGTVRAVVENLVQKKSIQGVYLGISHNLCRQVALERLDEMHRDGILKKLTVTNSIPQTEVFKELPYVSVRDLSPYFSRLIYRLHYNLPDDLETEGITNDKGSKKGIP